MGLGSRIGGSKRHRISDPDPQHCQKVQDCDPVNFTDTEVENLRCASFKTVHPQNVRFQNVRFQND